MSKTYHCRHAETAGGICLDCGHDEATGKTAKFADNDDGDEARLVVLRATVAKQKRLLKRYRTLHNGISDMIEGGRLKRADIPDDYRWLVINMVRIARADPS